jgi:hypothetical protein
MICSFINHCTLVPTPGFVVGNVSADTAPTSVSLSRSLSPQPKLFLGLFNYTSIGNLMPAGAQSKEETAKYGGNIGGEQENRGKHWLENSKTDEETLFGGKGKREETLVGEQENR